MYRHSFKCPKCKGKGKIDGNTCDLCKGDGTYFLNAKDEDEALKMEKLIKKQVKEGSSFL
jgi:DnaJ-class molecular chaperone with C-terminal Zn finger domain